MFGSNTVDSCLNAVRWTRLGWSLNKPVLVWSLLMTHPFFSPVRQQPRARMAG